jgi:superfamily II DNA or RNA helicase
MAKKATPKKAKKVSYHRQPDHLSNREYQLELRRQFGPKQQFELDNHGEHPVWSDFTVSNPGQKTAYRLAIRGTEAGDNFCECYDFRTNQLGTCKHLEWALVKLASTWGNKQYFKKGPPPARTYSSLAVDYGGEQPVLRLRIGDQQREAFTALATDYFTETGEVKHQAWLRVDQFLEAARALDDGFRCYPDALELIIQRREDERRDGIAQRLDKDVTSLDDVIKAKLYPYQREGALFAFQAGRAMIADEMGLGKTLQAIAAAELFRRELGVDAAYIVCPTSLKYQWQSEIEKFTNSTVQVIEGSQQKRMEQYADPSFFYKILTYNVVARDITYLNGQSPDLIILDEAQRIKNYDTKIAHAVKRLEAPHRIALTGTPLENKIEDLYSIVQFLDQYRLGPLWKLHARHIAHDENGIVRGYRYLDEINGKLTDLMIRRLKKNVAHQLPPRVDKNLLVPMTTPQRAMHDGYQNDVAQLVAKWRRHNFLSEQDRHRLMSYLQLMRMSCDSTYIVDQKHHHDTKIDELFYLLEERLADPEQKVVIFSQWARMTKLVGDRLAAKDITFASLHGGVPSKDRGALLDRFRDEDDCRIFLSTDAGGVGLNLQRAALIVNLDLPWNPAVLEQRIARVHRLGQERGVQVVNLISEGTIEHRMVHTLRFKSQLAAAVLDTGQDSVFMSDRKFSDFMEHLEKVQAAPITPSSGEPASDDTDNLETPAGQTAGNAAASLADPHGPADRDELPEWLQEEADQPTIPTPANASAPSDGLSASPAPEKEASPAGEHLTPEATEADTPGTANQARTSSADAAEPQSAAKLVSEGVSFLERLTKTLADEQATQALVGELTETDKDGRTYLKIPVESQATVANALKLLSGLFGKS